MLREKEWERDEEQETHLLLSPTVPSMAMLNKNNHISRHYSKHAGVGLGIVVALDKSNFATRTTATAGEILVKYTVVGALPSPRSDPIQVVSSGDHKRRICDEVKADYDDDEENFTYVTRRESTRSTTRVYHHKVEADEARRRRRTIKPPVFKVEQEADEQISRSNFLQACDLCRKPLLGKDIYMYRGEKAFCSEECRQKLIASDERKEKLCRAEAWKSSPSEMFSRSPCYYERGQIFSAGIVAI